MHTVVKLKLEPTAQQQAALDAQLCSANEAATQVSHLAMENQVFRAYDLRKLVYRDLRERGFGSQSAQHIIKKVADAYATKKANAKAGRYGPVGSVRRMRIEATAVTFRPYSSLAFDPRNLSWKKDQQLLGLFLQHERIRDITYVGRDIDLQMLRNHPVKECDLYRDRQGRWFLVATVVRDVPEVKDPVGMLGVDLGIVKIATVADEQGSDLHDWSGGAVTSRRKKNAHLRKKLQSKGTRSARRLLKKRSGRESRFVKDVNHQISKSIVNRAERTGRGIAVEKLTGIRERVRLRKPQRMMMHSWSFAQLGQLIEYKAALKGVCFVQVDPRNTSRMCSSCGHIDKKSRKNQETFVCTSCSYALNADTNAAINIARRGVDTRAQSIVHT